MAKEEMQFQPLPLHSMLEALFGTRSRAVENPITDTVGVAATRILASSPMRVGFIICNLSGNALYIAPTNRVSATRGIFVPPNGGTASVVWDRDFELCSMEWYALAGAAGSAVYVLENLNQ